MKHLLVLSLLGIILMSTVNHAQPIDDDPPATPGICNCLTCGTITPGGPDYVRPNPHDGYPNVEYLYKLACDTAVVDPYDPGKLDTIWGVYDGCFDLTFTITNCDSMRPIIGFDIFMDQWDSCLAPGLGFINPYRTSWPKPPVLGDTFSIAQNPQRPEVSSTEPVFVDWSKRFPPLGKCESRTVDLYLCPMKPTGDCTMNSEAFTFEITPVILDPVTHEKVPCPVNTPLYVALICHDTF